MDLTLGRQPALFPDDCLPPEGEYESRDALIKAINIWASTRGYAFITGRSTKEKTNRRTITYACDRFYHPPKSSTERQRKSTTRATSCQFSVLAKETQHGAWVLRHRPDKKFAVHNHEPSPHPSAHPAHRTLLKEDMAKLTSLSNAGIPAKNIRTYIRENTDSITTQQDIYNCITDVRRDTCEGQSSIHALADQLYKEGFWSQFQTGPDGRVMAILFAHLKSVGYLQAYPDILILDCTYKTNKYRMLLLDIIGVDACQRSFCIAFTFLNSESESDYH